MDQVVVDVLWTVGASKHLEGIKLFRVQVPFSWRNLKPLMLPPAQCDGCSGRWGSSLDVAGEESQQLM